jgi:hypothetical protein
MDSDSASVPMGRLAEAQRRNDAHADRAALELWSLVRKR